MGKLKQVGCISCLFLFKNVIFLINSRLCNSVLEAGVNDVMYSGSCVMFSS